MNVGRDWVFKYCRETEVEQSGDRMSFALRSTLRSTCKIGMFNIRLSYFTSPLALALRVISCDGPKME